MSVSNSEWHLASADCLFTDNEYIKLLEEFGDDKDLLKSIRCAAPNTECFGDFEIPEESSTFYPPSPPEIKPNEAELAEDTLQQLENECKQENVLPNWYEEKTNLALFEPIQQVIERVEPIPAAEHFTGPYAAQIVPERTQELLREFQTVYEVVGQTHDSYTPPQSPPGPATRLLVNFAHQTQCAPITPLVPIPPNEWQVNGTAELDDLVRHHVAQLASPQPSIPSAMTSPRSSPQSSPSSSPRSSSNDEEWCTSSRPKPYSRSTDDRRSRKKEQNKNAATRYRQKKKAEIEELLTEEQGLKQRNTELRSKCAELKRDTNCIKKLLRDVFKSKGLIK